MIGSRSPTSWPASTSEAPGGAASVGGCSPGVCLRRAALADSAPIVDVENLVQPLQGCAIELQFGSPIEPSELIDSPNADDGRSDGGCWSTQAVATTCSGSPSSRQSWEKFW